MVSKQDKDKCLKLLPDLEFKGVVDIENNGNKNILYAELNDDYFVLSEIESIVEVMKILNCDLEFTSWYDLERRILFTKTITND